MYFVNDEHESNFKQLLRLYPIGIADMEYQSGFYVVAHPVIFSYCNGNPVSDEHGPYDWYFETEKHSALPSSYLHLVQAGLHLYNNDRSFSLYLAIGTWENELFQVFMQACQIRRGGNCCHVRISQAQTAIGA
ncbi:hypothetical protein [Bacillus sp. FJAT-28004]|uniref:hypothetical protein n=1 Tax=Bacillus sp. FJAT-28004 TaxID=1679165 RepID=UPI0006B524B5|nr:hypothetical protein [Bacillus sp. FJAT-28004]